MPTSVLTVDVGGSHVKMLATGRRKPRKVVSGASYTPEELVRDVRAATADWSYDAISIGYPGPVAHDRIRREPVNLGCGWTGFDFARAFGMPVRVVNDAALQALGSYEGGRMLFLGLGTGLGTALIVDGTLVDLELGHLPYRKRRTFEQWVGDAARRRLGLAEWKAHVAAAITLLRAATNAEYVMLGGGNVRFFGRLPRGVRRGKNANAFRGGARLWETPEGRAR